MLLVKTAVKPSSIAGLGIFADQEIKKGEAIWLYSPETCLVFTRKQFDSLLKSFHKIENSIIQYYLTYGYYFSPLDALLILLDNARFFNHSDQPNSGGSFESPTELIGQRSIALRDIEKGEELTESYQSYDQSPWLDQLYTKYDIQQPR